MDRLLVELGRSIQKIRRQKGISQEELADKASLHVSTLGRIERGESNVPILTLYKISQALQRSLKDILG